MIAKVRAHGQTQSYPLRTGRLDPVEQVRGDGGQAEKINGRPNWGTEPGWDVDFPLPRI